MPDKTVRQYAQRKRCTFPTTALPEQVQGFATALRYISADLTSAPLHIFICIKQVEYTTFSLFCQQKYFSRDCHKKYIAFVKQL